MSRFTRCVIPGLAALWSCACAFASEDSEPESSYAEAALTMAGAPLRVVFEKTADWGSGFNGRLSVTNVSDVDFTDWSVLFTLPPLTTVSWCQLEGGEYSGRVPYDPRNGEHAIRLNATPETAVLQPGETLTFYLGGTYASDIFATVARCQIAGLGAGEWIAGYVPCDGSDNVTDPPVPQNLRAVAVTETTVNLEWDPVPDADVVAYRVYSNIGGPLTDVPGPAAQVEARDPGAETYYWLGAIDSAGNMSLVNTSNQIQVEFPPQHVAFTVEQSSTWAGGYLGQITLANVGEDPITNWAFSFAQAGITSAWGADSEILADGTVEVRAPSWSPVLRPGSSVTIGFVVGTEGADLVPDAFYFRGHECAAGGAACPEL